MGDATFIINWFWVLVSIGNFVLFVVLLYVVARFVRWLFVSRRRRGEELASLRGRVARLEGTQGGHDGTGSE